MGGQREGGLLGLRARLGAANRLRGRTETEFVRKSVEFERRRQEVFFFVLLSVLLSFFCSGLGGGREGARGT